MKLVVAYIKPERLNAVKQALYEMDIFKMSVTNALGCGEETAKSVEQISEEIQNNINIIWTCLAAFLVFFMQAGFAMVEAGFTRAKNAINILMKNLMDFRSLPRSNNFTKKRKISRKGAKTQGINKK
jgi:nitrogen regulatory protein PII